jgi:hypothetical protein
VTSAKTQNNDEEKKSKFLELVKVIETLDETQLRLLESRIIGLINAKVLSRSGTLYKIFGGE